MTDRRRHENEGEPLSCGHPAACLVYGGEKPACGWCRDIEIQRKNWHTLAAIYHARCERHDRDLSELDKLRQYQAYHAGCTKVRADLEAEVDRLRTQLADAVQLADAKLPTVDEMYGVWTGRGWLGVTNGATVSLAECPTPEANAAAFRLLSLPDGPTREELKARPAVGREKAREKCGDDYHVGPFHFVRWMDAQHYEHRAFQCSGCLMLTTTPFEPSEAARRLMEME